MGMDNAARSKPGRQSDSLAAAGGRVSDYTLFSMLELSHTAPADVI